MCGKACQPFPLRHGGASLHAGDDDRLADCGQGILGVQCSGSAAKAGNTGGVIVTNAVYVQCIHLFSDGTVQAGVAGVQTHGGLTCGFHPAHHVQYLLQRHLGTVVDGTVRLCQPQQRRVDQTARINNAVCGL